jgi:hypothetical protein
MGFLDNLESSLKSLEGNDERETAGEERRRRIDEKARAAAAAPYAEALKNGGFVNGLLNSALVLGHSMRVKVNLSWSGSTVRLDARGSRLELWPTPEGVMAGILPEGKAEPSETAMVDLNSDPARLADGWMAQVRQQVEAEKAAAAAAAAALAED